MKCRGCRCSLLFVLGTMLLAAAPLAGEPAPSLLTTNPSRAAGLFFETPEPAQHLAENLAELDQRIPAAQSSADNAWMLVSAALVLMMTGPGLALFYGGLVRRKNVLGTMMHSFILMAVITVVWVLFGYSLAFSEGTPFIGGLKYLFL